MKTTMDLPDDLVREVKLRAVVQGRNVKDLVAEFIRDGLGMAASGTKPLVSSTVEFGEDGMPLIRCRPEAPATRMSVDALLTLERELQAVEDLKHAGLAD